MSVSSEPVLAGSEGEPAVAQQRVAVLGGSGFIGAHVVKRLAHSGATVVSLGRSRRPAGHRRWLDDPQGPRRVERRWGLIQDPAVLAETVEGADTVICLASSSLPRTADLVAEVTDHVASTVAAATEAARMGVKRFIFASSGGTVYGIDSDRPIAEDWPKRPRNGYGASKLAIEHYLRLLAEQTAMTVVSLRVSNPFGEGQHALRGQGFIGVVMRHLYQGTELRIWGDGTAIRDFVDVTDVAEAFARAATYDGPPTELNIASGQGRSLLEVLEVIERVSGRVPQPRFESERRVDVAKNVLSIERAAQVLGWQPLIPFDQGIARTCRWWAESDRPDQDLEPTS